MCGPVMERTAKGFPFPRTIFPLLVVVIFPVIFILHHICIKISSFQFSVMEIGVCVCVVHELDCKQRDVKSK